MDAYGGSAYVHAASEPVLLIDRASGDVRPADVVACVPRAGTSGGLLARLVVPPDAARGLRPETFGPGIFPIDEGPGGARAVRGGSLKPGLLAMVDGRGYAFYHDNDTTLDGPCRRVEGRADRALARLAGRGRSRSAPDPAREPLLAGARPGSPADPQPEPDPPALEDGDFPPLE